MSLLHRTHSPEDTAVAHREGVRHDGAEQMSGTTRERWSTIAPGQIISLIVGAGFIVVGVLALVRAELDGSMATPVVEVMGYTHTAWLGFAEIGVGLLLMLAGTGAWGQPLSVLIGAALVVAGVVVLAEPNQMPSELGLEEDYGWPLVISGAVVALGGMLPVWRSHKVDHDTIDLRDDRSHSIDTAR